MKKYNVTFTQYHTYEVEADNDDMAYEEGYKVFVNDMRYPIANTIYDEVEIECLEDDDYEEEE